MGRQGFNGFGFVVFDANHNMVRVIENGTEDFNPLDNLTGALADRRVIGGDIGLTFRGIHNQGIYRPLTSGIKLNRGGETSAAHTGNTGIADHLNQLSWRYMFVVANTLVFNPSISTIGSDLNTGREHA